MARTVSQYTKTTINLPGFYQGIIHVQYERKAGTILFKI